ncbi:tyrosine-protein kinase family protein [Pseudomonas brassicacearum]|uniref:ParA family protein n=1 Tax=Pseudomonas brassicacearum TaxID=930166 RepID=A0AAJ3FUN7_9PSED|nr:ParA family protein [Pseudomonas brassicacearum]NUT80710.1 ParA family protein [Pseudomonas brassicacearum]
MSTFDQVLPKLQEIFSEHKDFFHRVAPLYVNRDLNGRVRLIVSAIWQSDQSVLDTLATISRQMFEKIGNHAFPPEQAVIFEDDLSRVGFGTPVFSLEGVPGVSMIDRLATQGNWSTITPASTGAPRVVFFSIKGGVGRSTAIAASAWSLAQSGKRVLVLDLDLESPGLSTSLLPLDRRPKYGITDWLVEDLIDNGDEVLDSMVASSALSHDGDIFVVPAHGVESGEYIAKLGRAWMPKVSATCRESWSQRLQRLISQLEERWAPDVILVDSRAGIDEVASTCITDLGANLVLLFALDGDQTWSGYRILFRHWRTTGVAREIRERLQVIGALIPELDGPEYTVGLREEAWSLFADELYDEVPAGTTATGETWSFDSADEGGPHYAWPIRWNRGFNSLRAVHSRLKGIDANEVLAVFGPVIQGVFSVVQGEDCS